MEGLEGEGGNNHRRTSRCNVLMIILLIDKDCFQRNGFIGFRNYDFRDIESVFSYRMVDCMPIP
jgi:hypothetical protein